MTKKILIALIIASLAAGAYYLYRTIKRPVYVRTHEIKREELLITVTSTSTGTVKTDNEYRLTAERTGTINRLYYDEGDIVKKVDIIALLDDRELLIKKRRAEARLNSVRRQTDETGSILQSLRVETESRIREAEAVLKEAESRYERYKNLSQKGYISELSLQEVKRQYEVAMASHEASIAGKKRVEAKEDELKKQKALINEAEAELALIVLDLERSYIKSPVDGVITSRPVKTGDTVMVGTDVATVVDTGDLYIEAPVDEADIDNVRLGQEVHVMMDAYPDEDLTGRVSTIAPVVLGKRLEARTFNVKVRLDRRPPTFKVGMSSDIEIITGKADNTLIVPTQAILEREGKRLVYLTDNGYVRLKEIKAGLFNWSFTEIKEGVREGDVIVINPDTPGLKDGIKVIITD